jgi:hypothetical protein
MKRGAYEPKLGKFLGSDQQSAPVLAYVASF